MYMEAMESYRLAKEYAIRYLGAEDGISVNLNNRYEQAKDEI